MESEGGDEPLGDGASPLKKVMSLIWPSVCLTLAVADITLGSPSGVCLFDSVVAFFGVTALALGCTGVYWIGFSSIGCILLRTAL